MDNRILRTGIPILLSSMTMLFFTCDDNDMSRVDQPETKSLYLVDWSEVESNEKILSSVLPKVLEEKDLANIIYNEASNKDTTDDEYALWDVVADIETSSGNTIRHEVQSVLVDRGHSHNEAIDFTASLDAIDYLQFYIYNFSLWNGDTTIESSWAPLTIDDVNIKKVYLYNTEGELDSMDYDVDDFEYNHPIIAVNLNEELYAKDILPKQTVKTSQPNTSSIYCTKIWVRKPRSLEWCLWGKADMVVQEKNTSGTGTIYKVANKKKKCTKEWRRTRTNYIDDGNSADIKVYEFDLVTSHEWVIEEATISNITQYGYNISVSDEGSYYECGNYTRCRYKFVKE